MKNYGICKIYNKREHLNNWGNNLYEGEITELHQLCVLSDKSKYIYQLWNESDSVQWSHYTNTCRNKNYESCIQNEHNIIDMIIIIGLNSLQLLNDAVWFFWVSFTWILLVANYLIFIRLLFKCNFLLEILTRAHMEVCSYNL